MKRFLLLFGLFLFLTLLSVQIAAKFPFKGEHIFVSGEMVNCSSCHVRQGEAFEQSAYHKSLNCRDCHAMGNPYRTGETAKNHSSAIITCTALGCHDNVTAKINSSYEAHRGLFREAATHQSIFGTYQENEACLVCHANFTRNITFIFPEYINFTLEINWSDNVTIPSCSNSNERKYNITSLDKGPPREVTISFTTRDPHNLLNISEIDCSITCHSYITSAMQYFPPHHATDVSDRGSDIGHMTSSYDYSYCVTCHRNTTFSSSAYVHSDEVHVAEAIECIDCHRSGGVMDIAEQEPLGGGEHACLLYYNVTSYAPKFQGDICISCHFTITHDALPTDGCICHSPVNADGTPGIGQNISGTIYFTIYSEPSGEKRRTINIID
jgi:hypothetical protein